MKKVILKLIMLLLPVLGMYVFVFFVLLKSGEFLSVREVIDRQMTDGRQVLYGEAYSDRGTQYKYLSVLKRAPSVLVIGKSRSLQIRSSFFKDPADFYNAGGGIVNIEDIQSFLEAIPKDKSPRLIILGLEQFFFNPNCLENGKFTLTDDINGFNILGDQGWAVFQDYIKHKFSLSQLTGQKSSPISYIGLNAIVDHNGFRKDGSYYYGKISEENSRDLHFEDTIDHIVRGNDLFVYGRHVSPEALVVLDKLLNFCKQRHIHVVTFLPPFSHLVFSKFASLHERYGYIFELDSKITPIFRKYDDPLYDFSDILSVGSSDLETYDGFHGSEKAYLRLFLLMLKGDPQLREVAADETYLRKRLADAVSPYVVFGNLEN